MDKAQWWMEMNVSEDTGLVVEGRECRMRNPRGKKNAGTMLTCFQDLGLYSKIVRRH